MKRLCACVQRHLTAHALGELSPGLSRIIRFHLTRCPTCRQKAETLRTNLVLLQNNLGQIPAPTQLDPSQRRAVLEAARFSAARPLLFSDHVARLLDRFSSAMIFTPSRYAPSLASVAVILLTVVLGFSLFLPSLSMSRGRVKVTDTIPECSAPHEGDALKLMPMAPEDRGIRPQTLQKESQPLSGRSSHTDAEKDDRTFAHRYAKRAAEQPKTFAEEAGEAGNGTVGLMTADSVEQMVLEPPPMRRPSPLSPTPSVSPHAHRKDLSGDRLRKTEVSSRENTEKLGAPASALTLPSQAPPADDESRVSRSRKAAPRDLSSRREPPAEEQPAAPVFFNPFVETVRQPFSTFSIDVDTASYTLTRLALRNGQWPPPESVRVEEFVNFFDYHYPAPLRDAFAIHAECGPSPFGPGLRLLRIGVQARRTGREGNRRALLTILIDTSGSMATPERLGLVTHSLRLLLDQLHPADRLALLAFDSKARLMLDYTPLSEKNKILQVVESLQPSGSTHMEAGLRLAFSTARAAFDPAASNRILLFSDGAANLGSTTADEILALIADSRRQGIFLSVYGVGRSGVHDQLLEQLANKGDGSYAFLDSVEEARRLFIDQLAATLHTIAADVKIQVEFNPESVRLYRQLGYENRQLTAEQFRDDHVDAGEVGAGQSVTALYELDFPPDAPADAPIGTVRIRYREVESNRIVESVVPLPSALTTDRVNSLSPSTLLAACAAEFAEILRGSPFASDGSLAEVTRQLQPVAAAFSLDPRVWELLDLVEQARSLQNRSP